VPFSSERKWSGLVLNEAGVETAYVLGAPEILALHLGLEQHVPGQADEWTAGGLRVLLFSSASATQRLHAPDGEPRVPNGLRALGLVSFSDELRTDARDTLAGFAAAGVELKLLSGDDPRTVHALAVQAGLIGKARLVSGPEMAGMDAAGRSDLAAEGSVFGRLAPAQKEQIVDALHAQGHYVGMMGDGVNDVLALKRADLAIAMHSGSAAARAVADLVLLKDSFAVLPLAFREGQRIQGGMHAILKLFLTRVLYVALLIVGLAVVDAGFPLAPKHNALLTLLTVGIPTLALAAWARPIEPREGSDSLFEFVVPAACTLALTGLGVYVGYVLFGALLDGQQVAPLLLSPGRQLVAQTALTTESVLCGVLLIVFVQPPVVMGGTRPADWWRPWLLASLLLAGFAFIMVDSQWRTLFELAPLGPVDYALLAGVATGWSLLVRWTWRARVLHRLLGDRPQRQIATP
jgi:cation-transporting P-type ATPase E